MAWTEAYSGSATIGATEYSATTNSTTIAAQTAKGTYQVFIDASALVAGDLFELRVLEKVRSSGAQREVMSASVGGGGPALLCLPALMLGNGWDVTLRRVAGDDRTIEWSIRAYS